ncbi:MAG TPA: response regulator [Bryobacteraceae bacterium]|nr:response regulator [Bryobacteraceae bacterium]
MQLSEAAILVVDDEPVLRDIVAAWFARAARSVATAADGAEALALLETGRFDLLVSDVRMPVMDGITLLRTAQAKGLKIPAVIFISGYSDIMPREAYALGAETLLEKPFTREDLLAAAQRSLCGRDELWQEQPDPSPRPALRRSFTSLERAVEEHRIAFGRGGICIESGPQVAEGPINLELEFPADHLLIEAQGDVRWVSRAENLAGIEFTCVAEGRGRLVPLAGASRSFIPRSTD